MTFESWLLFTLAIIVASISPGPNVLIVMIHSLKYGWRAATFTILGNVVCLFGIALLAALGVGALIKAEPLAYMILKTAGAAYLIYLGVKMIRASFNGLGKGAVLPGDPEQGPRPSAFSLASQSFLISASNPKSVIFLSAVFPLFLNESEPLVGQFAIMFTTIIVLVSSIHLTYAMVASALRRKIVRPQTQAQISRLTGGSFIALGGGVLLSD